MNGKTKECLFYKLRFSWQWKLRLSSAMWYCAVSQIGTKLDSTKSQNTRILRVTFVYAGPARFHKTCADKGHSYVSYEVPIPCRSELADCCRWFPASLNLQTWSWGDMFLQNVGLFSNYTALQPKNCTLHSILQHQLYLDKYKIGQSTQQIIEIETNYIL
jgi:hypothetical protein